MPALVQVTGVELHETTCGRFITLRKYILKTKLWTTVPKLGLQNQYYMTSGLIRIEKVLVQGVYGQEMSGF